VRPGERPATRLCDALDAPGQPLVAADRIAALLAHRGPSSSVLLVVDQLEELFTLASADGRESFLAALRALRAVPRCVVICTLRSQERRNSNPHPARRRHNHRHHHRPQNGY
jgi:hypothetical protein